MISHRSSSHLDLADEFVFWVRCQSILHLRRMPGSKRIAYGRLCASLCVTGVQRLGSQAVALSKRVVHGASLNRRESREG